MLDLFGQEISVPTTKRQPQARQASLFEAVATDRTATAQEQVLTLGAVAVEYAKVLYSYQLDANRLASVLADLATGRIATVKALRDKCNQLTRGE